MLQAQNIKITPQSNAILVDWDITDDSDPAINIHYQHSFHPTQGQGDIDEVIKESLGKFAEIQSMQIAYDSRGTVAISPDSGTLSSTKDIASQKITPVQIAPVDVTIPQ
jgi:hypothetical protein